MIQLLPKWNLQGNRPSFYDVESVTLLELASKLHGSMNELITDYNAYVDRVNKIIEEFMESTNGDQEAFETGMRQEFQDFIDVVQLRLDGGATQASIEEINQAKNNALNEIENALQGVLDGTY